MAATGPHDWADHIWGQAVVLESPRDPGTTRVPHLTHDQGGQDHDHRTAGGGHEAQAASAFGPGAIEPDEVGLATGWPLA